MTEGAKFDPRSKAFKEIKWIPVKNLSIVWAESQRILNEKHAQNIADNLDPEMFGTIAVTKPNGHGIYHVIDGQHRRVAIEKLWGADESVPCQVFDAEDPARAAQLFDVINTHRRKPSPVEIFKVRVTAQNELQTEINKIVVKCGYRIGEKNKNSIHCVAALELVYQSYGAIILEYTLKLIQQTWGEEPTAPVGDIVRGIGVFLSEFRNVNFDKLSTALAAKYTPSRFLGASRAGREVNGCSMTLAIRDLLIATYNKTVRGEKNKLRAKKK